MIFLGTFVILIAGLLFGTGIINCKLYRYISASGMLYSLSVTIIATIELGDSILQLQALFDSIIVVLVAIKVLKFENALDK